MENLTELISTLSEMHINQISHSPTIRKAFITDLVDEHGVDYESLENELMSLISINDELVVEEEPIPLKVVRNKVEWDLGEDFKTKQNKARLMEEIMLSLDGGGLSKTALLKKIKKDNKKWRKLASTTLEYMEGRGLIIKLSTTYYLNENHTYRETEFHRRIYSAVCEKPTTLSGIMAAVKYNNPKGRKRVIEVLCLMQEEGLIKKEKNKWELII